MQCCTGVLSVFAGVGVRFPEQKYKAAMRLMNAKDMTRYHSKSVKGKIG